ncbi:MAG: site-specific DNA-methyltransferase [Verrucomicrobia bacterium]|nr:site-specific DNA-methyltransferase [Verrucomicrobiota bacterium]
MAEAPTTPPATPAFQKLVAKLREVFQIDQPDLDFGIYRIINARAAEIGDYLQNKLRAKVDASLATGQQAGLADLQRDLAAAEQQARDLGADPATLPKGKDLRARCAALSGGASEHRDAVFSHLLTFFSRYYDRGDFISQRRYKGDTYAIPYSGEEVVLHWANKDQYYTKSGENFSNYTFSLDDGRRVHFRLAAADTAKDDRKDTDLERRFRLITPRTVTRTGDDGEEIQEEQTPIVEVTVPTPAGSDAKPTTELVLWFEYVPLPKKGDTQDVLNTRARDAVFADAAVKARWLDLARRMPTEKNPQRTLLDKHLGDYTEKNKADYFIHKDLGVFLRRELDFYIKNEVMHLDDVQNAQAFADIEKSLRLIQCLRAIALDLVAFLAQLEDFQKKLWLKKKFVVEAHYCVTLDRILKIGDDVSDPEEKRRVVAERDWLVQQIAASTKQITAWIDLGLVKNSACEPVIETLLGRGDTVAERLRANPFLMVDTQWFSTEFKYRLLAQLHDLDAQCDGLLVHSENFQALRLLQERYRGEVKCTYIDPPYNTGDDSFAYKDRYQHASWLAMIGDRLRVFSPFLEKKGVIFASIDEIERNSLERALDAVFGRESRVEELIWAKNTNKNQSPTYSTNHEYVPVYAKDIKAAKADLAMFRESKPGYLEIIELVTRLNDTHPPISEIEEALRSLYKEHKTQVESDEPDEWRGIYNYNRAEYRDPYGKFISEEEAKKKKAKIWVWREVDTSLPQVKEDSQKPEFRDANDPAYRFYKPIHPITGKPCPAPKTGWRWPFLPLGKQKSCFDARSRQSNRVG